VASAANLNGEAESPTTSSHSASARLDPVALEVAVNATGARPPQGNAPRELFSEETATVLVFHDGAVIRLSSAVLQGQLVFLTHKQTNREVVCQVVRKRASGPASSYVELQFTEPQDDFWGVVFENSGGSSPIFSSVTSEASQQALSGPTPSAEEAAEAAVLVLNSEPSDDDTGVPNVAPSKQEVEHLRDEIEVLRQQLKSLQSTPPAPSLAPAPIAPMSLPVAQLGAGSNSEGAPQGPSSSAISEPRGKEADTIDALLPKTSLDFSNVPARVPPPSDFSGTSPKVLIILVSLLLVVGAGGVAWSLGLLPFGHHAAQPAAPIAGQPNSPAKPPAKAAPNTSQPAAAKTSNASNAGAAPPNADSASATPPASDAQPESTPALEPSDSSSHSSKNSASNAHSSSHTAKTFEAAPAPTPNSPASDVSPDDSSVIPAKLLKSVQPVYPPDAMRNFITGDVRLDALVDAKGRVKSVEVLVGPSQLRQAAIDAIKQYQYAPATKGARAVDSHVTVTIKFWYNP